MTAAPDEHGRPPSVDALARSLAEGVDLPHAVLVDIARRAVATAGADAGPLAERMAREFSVALIGDVINATGVILHTNLGRAPLPHVSTGRASTLEFDPDTGSRGSRHTAIAALLRVLTGAEDAVVVNNNAAAVMLVLAALADGRDVAVSRGESVEIGGGFRIPDVMEQSGARLLDVGTTNRTKVDDYSRAVARGDTDVALLLKVHPSNFTVEGFTESATVRDLSTIGVPVVVDIGSGLLDSACPWVADSGRVPAFLRNEPAARQSLADGATLVTFSGYKLLGGPQCGIIAGSAGLVARCAAHPLMRALRPGGHTMRMLQEALLAHAGRTVCDDIPFWRMMTAPATVLEQRAGAVVAAAGRGTVVPTRALVGAGSVPGSSVESFGIALDGDVTRVLRAHDLPVIARVEDGRTIIDVRTVEPADDHFLVSALRTVR